MRAEFLFPRPLCHGYGCVAFVAALCFAWMGGSMAIVAQLGQGLGELLMFAWFVLFPLFCLYGLPRLLPERSPHRLVCGVDGVTLNGKPVTGGEVKLDGAHLIVGEHRVLVGHNANLPLDAVRNAMQAALDAMQERQGEVPEAMAKLRGQSRTVES